MNSSHSFADFQNLSSGNNEFHSLAFASFAYCIWPASFKVFFSVVSRLQIRFSVLYLSIMSSLVLETCLNLVGKKA